MSDTNQGVLAQHNAALAEGRFLIQQCGDCGHEPFYVGLGLLQRWHLVFDR